MRLAHLSGADLHGANLDGASLDGANLFAANLYGANLSGANLVGANLRSSNLSGVKLDGADLHGSNLRGANLHHATLRGTALHSAAMPDAILNEANLKGANLRGANLGGANLRDGNLSDANLSDSDLSDADIGDTDLRNADLRGAQLSHAKLSSARMRGADLGGAVVGGAVFNHLDLSEVKGLDSVKHRSPSSIGIDTIYRSHGKIPESFLRGAGVPENFITFMKSLTGAALDFYSVFISYSTKDQAFADRLYADLQAKGVRCWFAAHDIQGGRKIHEQIDEAIKIYDKLLLILSDASMNSEWVSTEIAKARRREQREKRRMLFPISLAPFEAVRDWECFDADAGKDSAREIREYFVPDFSNWKDHDIYAKEFDRLVRSLKADASRAAAPEPN